MSQVLLVEGCDFENGPPGGQLTFAKQLVSVYGAKLSLVGLTSAPDRLGVWTRRNLGGAEINFLPIGRMARNGEKPLVPARLAVHCAVRRWKREILNASTRDVLVLAPEVLLALHDWPWRSLCYYFAGVNNPLKRPRYSWAKPLSKLFERRLFNCLDHADALLAAADAAAIDELVRRAAGAVRRERIVQLPTFVDTRVFRPPPGPPAHDGHGTTVVACGRINAVKGWPFVLQSFSRFRERFDPFASMVFAGDGEDRAALEQQASGMGLGEHVEVTGFEPAAAVAKRLAAADVVVLGSHCEGWPTVLVEALACGRPVVSTDVSGARSLIAEGRNGFVVGQRDPEVFAEAIAKARNLPDASAVGIERAAEYSLDTLRIRLGRAWAPLR